VAVEQPMGPCLEVVSATLDDVENVASGLLIRHLRIAFGPFAKPAQEEIEHIFRSILRIVHKPTDRAHGPLR
jgi:hypothetical protein